MNLHWSVGMKSSLENIQRGKKKYSTATKMCAWQLKRKLCESSINFTN